MHKRLLFAFLLAMSVHIVNAQDECKVTVYGHISFESNANPISAVKATVTVPKLNVSVLTDSLGNFSFLSKCMQKLELRISYLGYTADTLVQIKNDDVNVNVTLSNVAKVLKGVVVREEIIQKDNITTAVKSSLSGKALEETRGLSLGESLKGITGVTTLQNGPSISKPIIHGLYSNRVLIMNNGVRQESQQWGNDHAPEIDPFIATKLTVIKGAASIRYGSDAIGGVVSVEPKDMPTQPGVDGDLNIVGMSNGRMGVASGMIEGAAAKKPEGLSWRVQGTVKQSGNVQTPHYFIGNTALREDDYSATVAYNKKTYGAGLYYSKFDTKIGIADASVIGSGQDFLSIPAEPAVPADFSYLIRRPYQSVNHQLIKASGFLNLPNSGKLEGVYAFQHDVRKEYDAAPNANSNTNDIDKIPDVDLRLNTSTADLIWEHPAINKKIIGSVGLNFITHGNLEQGTTYLQLIPNFRDYGGGIFAIEKWRQNKLILEGGLRYDYRWLRAYMLQPATLIEEQPTHRWQNATVNLGATYQFNNKLTATFNFGSAWRPPSVLELYADGIHQAAAVWERGDSALNVEKAYNTSIAVRYETRHFNAELGIYANYFGNYIYAKPDSLPAYTAAGQFPSFNYTQIRDALFTGTDFTFDYSFLRHFTLTSKTSLLRARNLNTREWIIDVPPDRYDNSLRYQWDSLGRWKNVYVNLGNIVVDRQTRTPPRIMPEEGQSLTKPEQVYNKLIAAPGGYMLWNAEVGCSIPLHQSNIDISLSVTNLTNTVYRDYLDIFRYYIDGLGRSFILRIKIPFTLSKQHAPS
ncbi:MAG TPA: TonB-dependent receptor [Chitinophagaceae bacterium]|nr:TonB-dependent receptor [Chitinophagaceae bacterium]